jgi:hypothetical protein
MLAAACPVSMTAAASLIHCSIICVLPSILLAGQVRTEDTFFYLKGQHALQSCVTTAGMPVVLHVLLQAALLLH